MTTTVETYHTAIRKLVAERFAASPGSRGRRPSPIRSWSSPARTSRRSRPTCSPPATGSRCRPWSRCRRSRTSTRPVRACRTRATSATDEQGRPIVGTGRQRVQGQGRRHRHGALRLRRRDRDGRCSPRACPEGTIAVIDDSGGTLTAPILEDFAGVLCMGGTVRSHLGILTREYGVPCLMAAELDGLADGDAILVEYSKPAADAYAERDDAARARDDQGLREDSTMPAPYSYTRPPRRQRLDPQGQRQVLLPVHGTHRAGVEALPRQPLHRAVLPQRLVPLARAAAQDRRGDACRGDRATAPARSAATPNVLTTGIIPQFYLGGRQILIDMGMLKADRRDRRRHVRARLRPQAQPLLPPHPRAHLRQRRGPARAAAHRADDAGVRGRRARRRSPATGCTRAFGQLPGDRVAVRRSSSHCECRLGFGNRGPYKVGGARDARARLARRRRGRPTLDGRGRVATSRTPTSRCP